VHLGPGAGTGIQAELKPRCESVRVQLPPRVFFMKQDIPRYYVLEGHIPVPCDLMVWAVKLQETRKIARDLLKDILVSTIFLGLDHNFIGEGPPVLFETMAFDEGKCNGQSILYENRYCTWSEAEAGHKGVINIINNEKEWPLYIHDSDYGLLVMRLLERCPDSSTG
jgi:hypothetical protein